MLRFLDGNTYHFSTDLVLLNLTETLFVRKSILKCHHCVNAMKSSSSDKANSKMYKKTSIIPEPYKHKLDVTNKL